MSRVRTHWSLVAAVLATACIAPAGEGPAEPAFLSSPEFLELGLPFSEAVRHGDTLYLSGQLGTRPGGTELVPGGIRAEAHQVLENVRDVLERNGSSLDRVLKCTVFLADVAEWAAFNEVYVEFFPAPHPARSALGAGGLALGARVELECIAAVAPESAN